jgi:hypothetical protein
MAGSSPSWSGRVDDIRHEAQVLAAGTSGRHVDEPDLRTIDSPFFVDGQEKGTAAHRSCDWRK